MRVAIIIPVMDRAAELRRSLPRLLAQDYGEFGVYLVDHGSTDDLASVVAGFRSDRLQVLGCPRSEYFSFSRSRNIGTRYSTGELLLFMNGDNYLETPHSLTEAVDAFLMEPRVEWEWVASWRRRGKHGAVSSGRAGTLKGRYRNVFCHTHGSILLVERAVFQAVGGFNEMLEDWGYEDTDLIARLELGGLGRVAMKGVGVLSQPHEEDLRVRFFRQKNTQLTWLRNRMLSDYMIKRWGHILSAVPDPGRCPTIVIGGQEVSGLTAPQQPWSVEPHLSAEERAHIRELATEYSKTAMTQLSGGLRARLHAFGSLFQLHRAQRL